ncbi:Hsp20/alpha crystallin family protein [Spirosoma soli]|uniref:Hsp20/alpha crystallin family protein n=1 Tax=Spirosoma soli TaxID=1770529 RepID=A0ABW5MBK6_9BACT
MATLVRYNSLPTFFNPFFGSRVYGRPIVARYQNTNVNAPAVNVKETETAFQLELAAPGLKKEDVKVNVENNKLTIAYKHEVKADETTETYTRHEFGFNAFERSFRLPKNVNADQITAAYTDGILTVELPKVEVKEEKLVKEITVA